MNILHYSLGFPPYSRGGLTKYAVDLIEEEQIQGHQVCMIWPGRITRSRNVKIIQSHDYNEIKSYELVNPEYLPQIYGINQIDLFQKNIDKNIYIDFLKIICPDVIHIHTLMGMHLAFLEAAKYLKIKTVYTTHDFFGICPKTTLYFNGKTCKDNLNCIGCSECCANALSIKKMTVLQSKLYRTIKNMKVVKYIRAHQKGKAFELDNQKRTCEIEASIYDEKYVELRNKYINYFNNMTVIHFNSTYMKDVFEKYFAIKRNIVCNLSHRDIRDNRNKHTKKIDSKRIRFAYLGPIAEYKGFYKLISAMDELYKEGNQNFSLEIYHQIDTNKQYIISNEPYKYENLDKIMNKVDLIFVPHDVSYGFIALEALSFGVPVFVTDEVGAKDLLEGKNVGVVTKYNVVDIKKGIKDIVNNSKRLAEMQENIKKDFHIKNMEEHCREVVSQIYC